LFLGPKNIYTLPKKKYGKLADLNVAVYIESGGVFVKRSIIKCWRPDGEVAWK
jgi:hypothetical protein